MTVARWQATITDENGDVVASASVAVVSETSGALATIYSDRAGAVSISNPMTADSDGFVSFYAAGDAYKITATSGSTTREFRYVGIGTSSEEDKQLVTLAESTFSGSTYLRFSNLDLYRKIIIEVERLNNVVDASDLYAFLSIDDGSTFIQGTSNLFTLDHRTAATAALTGSTGTSFLQLADDLGTGTGEFYQGVITMINHTDTSTYKYLNSLGSVYDATPEFRAADMKGIVLTGGSVTDIQIQPSSSTFSGKVVMKGELL